MTFSYFIYIYVSYNLQLQLKAKLLFVVFLAVPHPHIIIKSTAMFSVISLFMFKSKYRLLRAEMCLLHSSELCVCVLCVRIYIHILTSVPCRSAITTGSEKCGQDLFRDCAKCIYCVQMRIKRATLCS